ncbi:hypothetical protein NPIL_62281 [Nephila pilipes]|uniref:Uncharacterized protein n=1 Tax=Nephila pilipes TaxID=299642 RepID=A0A8X6R6F4_NEPPI|nr:hypothetical protein NPIL_62281 [Nephila pilipes]
MKPADTLNIANYITHRTDRTAYAGGGTALLIKTGPTGMKYGSVRKASLLGDSLENQFTNNRTPSNDFHTNRMLSCMQDYFNQPPDTSIPPLTSPLEV